MLNNLSRQTKLKGSSHADVIYAYGVFMVAWSVLESVVQAAIMKQLGVDPVKAVIVTGKLQFNPRIQLLCALLKVHGDSYRDAIKLLNKTESFAQRNVVVHGLIVVGVPGELSFVKYDGGNSVRRRFSAEELIRHVNALNERIKEIQRLLMVSDADIQVIGDATLSMV